MHAPSWTYRDQLLTFNDDIQGTSAVALGTILGAVRRDGSDSTTSISSCSVQGRPPSALPTGSAWHAGEGLSEAELGAASGWWIRWLSAYGPARSDARAARLCSAEADSQGGRGRSTGHDRPCRCDRPDRGDDPDRAFDRRRALYGTDRPRDGPKIERPVIFPLSNPTTQSEAHRRPASLDRRTGPGRHRLTFPASRLGGRRSPIAQCNNVFIFPAVGWASSHPALAR